ncbi:MAG: EAL domain-containing protein [Oxalicibacterium faecigallinarum]|uniref:EAL domain-containing protein n=1 Tax=Oxalicibacterium faecigallinarum TaxID=573741 RepID=UPI0028067610|nr:EAL domain-containing protein [Oxalicibacterium faecigallinarum]MDQ7970826.1 EAL domain-containing protein [Oxalicibacterium faecigallinarum]
MNRSRVIILATVLALIGIAIPLSATVYLSWVRANQVEEDRLMFFAQRALERAHISFRDASLTLKQLDHASFAPCSPEHIRQMRVATITTRSVDDIGYFEDGYLKCTSTGMMVDKIALAPEQYTSQDGIRFSLTMSPVISDGRRLIGLAYNAHKALLDPVRFADIILDDDMQLAVGLSDGSLLGSVHDPDQAFIKSLVASPHAQRDDEVLHALAREGDLIAVTIEPDFRLFKQLRQELLILLPLGILMAIFTVSLVIWFSRRRLSPLGELKIAVEHKEFVLHYQPIVSLKTGACIGAEALVRWQRPDGSMTRPDLFIPLAEESGLIMQITDQVLDILVRELKPFLNANRDAHIAVNLSAQDIKSGRILPVLQQKLYGTGIDNHQIWLEATERGFMDVQAARSTIDIARTRGHAVAIDDFGTGYSSLSYLQGLPMDALKIDKSFVDTIGTDAATASVTTHIINIAKTLNLKIVAEGVETQAQADYLSARDVEYGQGWLFAKAMPANDFVAFYHKSRRQLDSDVPAS